MPRGSVTALDIQEDAEEFHVISVIVASVASLFVILLLTIVVLFSSQIRPILEWAPIQPAITNISPVLYAILISGSIRKKPVLCIATSLLLIPVIRYLNPLTNSAAGALGGMVIAAALGVLLMKCAKEKK